MEEIKLIKKDETWMHIDADASTIYELKDYFTFYVPGYKFHPKFKAKVWDGKISMLGYPSCNIYIGLLDNIKKFAAERNYKLVVDPALKEKTNISPGDVYQFVKSLNLHSDGNKIAARDYQLAAIYYALYNKRITLLSPTSSGKSLIIYCIIGWLLNQSEMTGSVLLIVPNVGLVQQMFSDFKDYSSDNDFDVLRDVQVIQGGKSKLVQSKVVISTWQSIYKEDSIWFNQFNGIIVDEVHLAAANSLKGIMEKSIKVPFRVGLTGTLSDAKTHEYVITGLFGKVHKVTTTTELIEKGSISDIEIECILLNYKDKEEIKLVKTASYFEELIHICASEKRNNFLVKRIIESKSSNDVKGNTLVLFQMVEKHGKVLYDMIKKELGENSTRKLFFIHGGVEGEERDAMRAIVEKEDDAIIIASYGTLSTGTSIKRLHNIYAASPTKSMVRVLQSIGRGLRLGKDKTVFKWFDIADDFSNGTKNKNYAYLHFIKRLEIYNQQGFKYKITKVDI